MTLEQSEKVEEKEVEPLVLTEIFDWHRRSHIQCQTYVAAVPTPPLTYAFSNRQLRQQTQFFHQKQDLKLPDAETNLYNASLIAVCKFNSIE